MKVELLETDSALIINLEGEMMLGYEANEFHEAIRSGIEKRKKNIIVDLSKVKFITSWGIGILIYGYTTSTNSGLSFKLASVPQIIKESLIKVKIDSVFHQYDTVEEALKN